VKYVNDTGLPSVTDILSPYVDRRWFKKIHLDRGNACHDAMAAHASLVPYFGNGFNPLWQPYVDSGKKWFDENVREVLMVEERLTLVGHYTGQLDLVAILNDNLTALIDWKTSKATAKTWRFQTAAYQNLVHLHPLIDNRKIDIRMTVRLRSDYDKPCLVNKYEHDEYDLNIFECAMAVHRELS